MSWLSASAEWHSAFRILDGFQFVFKVIDEAMMDEPVHRLLTLEKIAPSNSLTERTTPRDETSGLVNGSS